MPEMTLVVNDTELSDFYSFISRASDIYRNTSHISDPHGREYMTTIEYWRDAMRESYGKNDIHAMVFDSNDIETMREILTVCRDRGEAKPHLFRSIYSLLEIF